MTEHTRKVHTYRVEYRCDKCGSLMRFTGAVKPSLPPQYEHHCRNNHVILLPRSYPAFDYTEFDDDE